MAVSINARSTAQTKANNSAGPHDHANLTIAAGTDTVLVAHVFVEDFGGTPSSIAAVWDPTGANQSMTAITGASFDGSGIHIRQFGLVAPTTGNLTLRVSWSGGNGDVCVFAIAYDGANQTGGATSFPHGTSANGSSTTPSIAVTSAAGNWTQALLGTTGGVTGGANNTSNFNELGLNNGCASAQDATGAASVTHSWTLAPSGTWAIVATDIAVAGGGGGGKVTKNTRSFPLGMAIGMNWREPGVCS